MKFWRCNHKGSCWCKKGYGWILGIVTGLLLSKFVFACPKGQSVWQDGCVVDIAPEIAKPVQPSDEVAPKDKMPSYQREGVTVITAPNMNDSDVNADKAKFQANEEGKRKAGIK